MCYTAFYKQKNITGTVKKIYRYGQRDYLMANHLSNDEINRKADGLPDSATGLAELATTKTGPDVRHSLDRLNDITKQINSKSALGYSSHPGSR